MCRPKHGFTLVELLVVMAVIGLLVALLIPAVSAVRENAKRTTCMNNQKQLGTAILAYEVAKRRLPGVMDSLPSGSAGPKFSWAAAILPELEHNDIWKIIQGGGSSTVSIGVFTCPNDPFLMDKANARFTALLSYGVNDAFFLNYLKYPPVNRSDVVVMPPVLSKLASQPIPGTARWKAKPAAPITLATTIMLGERTLPDENYNVTANNQAVPRSRAGKWIDTTWESLAFPWPIEPANTSAATPFPAPLSPYIMKSSHFGKAIITFFDGHSDTVGEETAYPIP